MPLLSKISNSPDTDIEYCPPIGEYPISFKVCHDVAMLCCRHPLGVAHSHAGSGLLQRGCGRRHGSHGRPCPHLFSDQGSEQVIMVHSTVFLYSFNADKGSFIPPRSHNVCHGWKSFIRKHLIWPCLYWLCFQLGHENSEK